MGVERWREKAPELPDDDGGREDDSQRQRGVEQYVEGRSRVRVDQLLSVKQRQDRALENSDDVKPREQGEGNDNSDDDCARDPEETLTQLLQMIQDRHLLAGSFAHTTAPCYRIDWRRSSASAASSERGKRLMMSW